MREEGVPNTDANRIATGEAIAGLLDYLYSNAIRPVGEKYLLPLEHAAFDAVGLKPREVDFDSFEGAAKKAVEAAKQASMSGAQNARDASIAPLGFIGPLPPYPLPTPNVVTPGGFPSPENLDHQLDLARQVIGRIEVDVNSEVTVKGEIDGAKITDTRSNTVKRATGGSNMPLRSRAGRTGE